MRLLHDINFRPEKLITLSGIFCFFTLQAWDKAATTDAAIILWLTGIVFAFKDKGLSALSKPQLVISTLSVLTFYSYFISWLYTPYQVDIKNLEAAFRFLILPFIILSIVRSKITPKEIIFALFASGISYAASAYYEYNYLHNYRVNGDENAVTFGNGAILIFSCLVFSLMIPMRWFFRIAIAIAATAAFYASVLSGTRSSMLVLVPMLIIISWLYGKKSIPVITVGLIGLIVFSLNSSFVPNNIDRSIKNVEKYFEQNNTYTSIGQRFKLWETSVCLFEEYPWWGIGPKTFQNVMIDKQDPCYTKVATRKGYFNHAHSLYFHSLATKGIIGTFILFSFFISIIWFSLQNKFVMSNIILMALVSMLTYGISMDLLYTRFIIDKHLTLLAILIGVSNIGVQYRQTLRTKEDFQ